MRIATFARSLLPLALLAVAACAETADDTTVVTGDTTTLATPADQAATGTPTAPGMASTFTLQPLADSRVGGEATLTEEGARTQVLVRLTGSEPDATHQGHIHQGTCQSPGTVVAPLQPIHVDAGGSGTSTSTVDVPISTATNGQHIVVYHEAGGSPGRPIVCGEIPQR